MKLLLITTAVVEGVIGSALLIFPGVMVPYLLASPLDTPAGIVAARLAGAGLFSLAIACWQLRNNERANAKGLVAAMLFYNEAAALILVYSSIRLGLQGVLIWPAFVTHEALAAWCILNLWVTQRRSLKAANSPEAPDLL